MGIGRNYQKCITLRKLSFVDEMDEITKDIYHWYSIN